MKNCIPPTPSALVNPLPIQLISQLSQSLILLIVLTFSNHINKEQMAKESRIHQCTSFDLEIPSSKDPTYLIF